MLILLACHAPLPEAVDIAYEAPPLAPGWGVGPVHQLEPVPGGMVAVASDATLWIVGETTHVLPLVGVTVDDAGAGVLYVHEAHGDFGYDYRSGRFIAAPVVPAAPAGSLAALDGTVLVVDGERLPLSLPADTRAWVAEVTADEVIVGAEPRLAWGARGLGFLDATSVLVTVTRRPLQETSRLVLPARSAVPWDGLQAVRRVDGLTWVIVDQRLAILRGDHLEPVPEVGRVVALAVDAEGRLWAGGDDLWRRDATWTRMRAARPVADIGGRGRAWLASPLWYGSARPALNAALLADGAVTCGDPTDPDRLLAAWGGCGGWLALSWGGTVWSGDAAGRVALDPPVGDVVTVSVHGNTVLVAGTEAVAWTEWSPNRQSRAWTRVPTADVTFVAGRVGRWATDVWFARRDAFCHTRGDTPSCFASTDVTGLAAGPDGAWVVDDGQVYSVAPGASPVERPEVAPPNTWIAGVAYDDVYDRVWTWSGAGLHAYDPHTGEQRSYEGPYPSAIAAVGDRLVMGSATNPRVGRLR